MFVTSTAFLGFAMTVGLHQRDTVSPQEKDVSEWRCRHSPAKTGPRRRGAPHGADGHRRADCCCVSPLSLQNRNTRKADMWTFCTLFSILELRTALGTGHVGGAQSMFPGPCGSLCSPWIWNAETVTGHQQATECHPTGCKE